MKVKHYAFFSQTGSEIAAIAKQTGEWPDKIITNKRPNKKRSISPLLARKKIVRFVLLIIMAILCAKNVKQVFICSYIIIISYANYAIQAVMECVTVQLITVFKMITL